MIKLSRWFGYFITSNSIERKVVLCAPSPCRFSFLNFSSEVRPLRTLRTEVVVD